MATMYRGTSLIRNRPPSRTAMGATVRSSGKVLSYERDTPVQGLLEDKKIQSKVKGYFGSVQGYFGYF